MNLEAALDLARPLLARAVAGTFYAIEPIEDSIRKGQAQLWLGADCFVVTELQDYPSGVRTIQGLWAGGELDAILALLPEVEAWARHKGCTEFLVESRAGWQRVLKKHGFDPWSVTVRKAL